MVTRNNSLSKTDVRKIVETETRKLENRLKKIDKDNLNMKVEILGELQKMRDDDAAHQFSHMRVNDDLVDHEKRIKKLETVSI